MKASRIPESYLRNYLRSTNSPYVFLETLAFDPDNKKSILFNRFSKVILFHHGDDINLFFSQLEEFTSKGYWLCGYFSYEFGYYLEQSLFSLQEKTQEPLAWIGVCKEPQVIEHKNNFLYSTSKNFSSALLSKPSFKRKNIRASISREEYLSTIGKIKQYLEEGFSYQVNFTFKVSFDFYGDLINFYLSLRKAQPTSYTALINTGEEAILSFSPELFFNISKGEITTRPMKGTAKRGLTPKEDKQAILNLKKNEKIRAENLMIVDLLRNDLGRIGDRVRVCSLFDVERYRTLYQMTSTIKARVKKDLGLKDLFSSLFPCGSVTGAPKIKTMDIIKNLESQPRGVYTGAIGYISPQEEMCFNVAIRTIHLRGGRGELGVGGGILYDSLDKSEYDEAMLKANFFLGSLSDTSLIEAILWREGEGYFLLELHLCRLKASCKYFSIPLNMQNLKFQLKNIVKNEKGRLKIRILVDMNGSLSMEKERLTKVGTLVKVKISSVRIDSQNPFLYHKTTQRDLYVKERAKAREKGFYEVIFMNEKGQLTEGTTTNIFILKKKVLYTPALKSGLLAGTLREHFLRENKVLEKVIYLRDLLEADKVYIGNSVRGLIESQIVQPLSQGRKKIEKAELFSRI